MGFIVLSECVASTFKWRYNYDQVCVDEQIGNSSLPDRDGSTRVLETIFLLKLGLISRKRSRCFVLGDVAAKNKEKEGFKKKTYLPC